MGLTAEKSSPQNGGYYQISNKVNNGLDRYSSEIIYVIPMGYHFGVLGPPLVQVVPDVIETVEGRNVTVMCNVRRILNQTGSYGKSLMEFFPARGPLLLKEISL